MTGRGVVWFSALAGLDGCMSILGIAD